MSELSDPGTEPGWQRFDLATEREAGFAAARAALAAGRCVVLPTDTVYGIAADAMSPEAVQGLLDAKQRGRDMPPPVLIAEPAMLAALVAEPSDDVRKLVDRFWPGPLTVIMKAQASLRMDLGQTHGTIAVRVPDHADARGLLRVTGPLAVSSANVSGHEAATNIDDAIAMLGDSVAVYLDGGPTPGPVPSTIVDFAAASTGRIVRAGVLTHEVLAGVLPGLADTAPAPASGGEPAEAAPAQDDPPFAPDDAADDPVASTPDA